MDRASTRCFSLLSPTAPGLRRFAICVLAISISGVNSPHHATERFARFNPDSSTHEGLDSVQRERRAQGVVGRAKARCDDFAFNSQKATRLSRITVYKLFRAIARAAGLPETLQHPHVLKHTAAMLMIRAGANAFLIRQHLGHRSFDSTLAYVNPSDSEASAAASKAFSLAF